MKNVTGTAVDGPFWKYHFQNTVFGGLRKASPHVRKLGFREGIAGLNPRTLHITDPRIGNRLTIPRSVVEECSLQDLSEFAIAFPYADWTIHTLVLIPLRATAFKTMFTGAQPDGTPAFGVCDRSSRPKLQPPFEWEGATAADGTKRYAFQHFECILFLRSFHIHREGSIRSDGPGERNYSVGIPPSLRVSSVESSQHGTLKVRSAFAMSYDALGNILLFRQPLDFFSAFSNQKQI